MTDTIYPIGSIYMSVNSTNPSVLFGGTWERIQNRFLLGAGSSYNAGSTGGEATHTLTTSEMPSHTHASLGGNYFIDVNKAIATGDTKRNAPSNTSGNYYLQSTEKPTITRESTTASIGGGTAHNNMPPYIAVYVWKRTA